jgi:hypothetical protein
MNKSLGLIAATGLILALLFFVLAALVSPDVLRQIGRPRETAQSSAPGVRQMAWDGDDRLQIDMPAKVILMPGGPLGVIVRGDQDLVQQVRLDHGKLSDDDDDDCFIPFFCGMYHRHPVTVELHGVLLRNLRVNGVAQVDMGHLDQDRLTLRLSGAGKVEGEGRLDSLDVSISGAGDANFGGLAVGRAKVSLSGVGNAEISPSQEADIHISGVGNVRLDTRPAKLTTHLSGVGSVSGPGSDNHRDEDDDGQKSEAAPLQPAPPAPPVRGEGKAISDTVQNSVQKALEDAHIRDTVQKSVKKALDDAQFHDN